MEEAVMEKLLDLREKIPIFRERILNMLDQSENQIQEILTANSGENVNLFDLNIILCMVDALLKNSN